MSDEGGYPKFKYHPNFYDLEKDGWLSGLLFRCLHCGGYRLIVEAD